MQKGAYPYEYMSDWEKSNGTSLPQKEHFYSQLNMEDILMQVTLVQKEFAKILK